MFAFTVTDTDFGIGAVVVVVLAYLVYRLFRREPRDRLVRLGVFMERERIKDDGDAVTERREWPRRRDDS